MEAKTAKEIFNFLPGIWKIGKRITAKMPEQNAIAHGYGLFIVSKKNPNFISYSEQVSVHYLKSNTTHIGKQQYIYLYDAAGLSLSKYFHDGRLFYRLHLQDGQINGTHVCMEDTYYLSTYIFKKDGFSITYSVNGPLKCYEITTIYTNIPSSTPTKLPTLAK